MLRSVDDMVERFITFLTQAGVMDETCVHTPSCCAARVGIPPHTHCDIDWCLHLAGTSSFLQIMAITYVSPPFPTAWIDSPARTQQKTAVRLRLKADRVSCLP